ncbi:MAG: hypothetical protein HYY37_02345 [Candidatus Aenigmarchaeota archaeon]|nr:hypothetical protein [Candidatus Aenigmarchaeota archaeon]
MVALTLEEIPATYIVWILALVVIVAMFVVFLIASFTNKSLSLSFNLKFVDIMNRPYNVQEMLTHYRVSDRQLLEHALETSVAGSAGAAGSDEAAVQRSVGEFVGIYALRDYYGFTVMRNSQKILAFDNTPFRCGQVEEGTCIGNFQFTNFEPCPVGFVEVQENPDYNDPSRCDKKMGSSAVRCCRYDPPAYASRGGNGGTPGKFAVVTCGDYALGICNAGVLGDTYLPCGATMVKIDDTGDCLDINNGETPICCMAKNPQLMAAANLIGSAAVPLFYKGNLYGEMVIALGG